jgi:hypothetical protein
MKPSRTILLPLLFLNLAIPPIIASASGKGEAPLVQEGFENGLPKPWGTGHLTEKRPTWWNSMECQSTAEVDSLVQYGGSKSLHVVNSSARKPHVFGTASRPIRLQPGQRYRLSVQAMGRNLASDGAVNFAVDNKWLIRPVHLPKGTYGWRELTGEFVAQAPEGTLRIILEDRGEAWLDDIVLIQVDEQEPARDTLASVSGNPADDRTDTASGTRRGGDGPTDSAATYADQEAAVYFLKAAVEFQQTAANDCGSALGQKALDDARQDFEKLNRLVWGDVPSRQGWAYFFPASILVLGNAGNGGAITAYYHPWSDVFLVSVWKAEPSGPRIRDAELLMGEWVRRGGIPAASTPAWRRSDEFQPLAVGMITAESVRAFENRFGDADPTHWRERLPGLDNRQALEEANYRGVTVLFLEGLVRLEDFQTPRDDEPPQLDDLRSGTNTAMKLALSGKFEELFALADDTTPEIRQLWQRTPPEDFGALSVASTVVGSDASVVFLIPVGTADRFFSFYFVGSPEEQQLKRIDIVSFEGCYQELLSRKP